MVNHLLLVLKPVLALVLLALFAGLYFLAKDKDRDFAEEINRYGFKLAFLAPIGFFWRKSYPINSTRVTTVKLEAGLLSCLASGKPAPILLSISLKKQP